MESSQVKENVQKWLKRTLNDQLLKIMLKNNFLTKKQLETLLIDILSEEISEKKLSYDEKSKMRLKNSGVSRGAFNRTLQQARKNVINSIYTIMLLGYLGILETPNLHPFMALSNKLKTYMEEHNQITKKTNTKINNDRKKMLLTLRENLIADIKELSDYKNLKTM